MNPNDRSAAAVVVVVHSKYKVKNKIEVMIHRQIKSLEWNTLMRLHVGVLHAIMLLYSYTHMHIFRGEKSLGAHLFVLVYSGTMIKNIFHIWKIQFKRKITTAKITTTTTTMMTKIIFEKKKKCSIYFPEICTTKFKWPSFLYCPFERLETYHIQVAN